MTEDALEHHREIKRKFDRTYYFSPPYAEYVRGSSLLTLRECLEQGREVSNGKSLDDYCIAVSLKKDPAKKVIFPREYEGIIILYKITG